MTQSGGPPTNVQDAFLSAAVKTAVKLGFVLTNGEVITGRLRRFDRFALVVEDSGRQILLYKHAVAAIRSADDL